MAIKSTSGKGQIMEEINQSEKKKVVAEKSAPTKPTGIELWEQNVRASIETERKEIETCRRIVVEAMTKLVHAIPLIEIIDDIETDHPMLSVSTLASFSYDLSDQGVIRIDEGGIVHPARSQAAH